jgi:hypothetical protein
MSIKNLEVKMEIINEVIEKRTANLETQLQSVKIGVRDIKNVVKSVDERAKEKPCTYFNKGFSKKNERCNFRHKSMKIFENHFDVFPKNVIGDILKPVDIFLEATVVEEICASISTNIIKHI